MEISRRTAKLDWLMGRSRPSRPPDAEFGVQGSEPGLIGISCSGGGIRSAAYNLGALQVLRSRDVLGRARWLAAVSGGSYIAASHAIVAANSAPDLLDSSPVYAAGSPEERWFRNHSTYLAPNVKVRLRLALNLLYGLVGNLIMLWLCLYVVARPLGWAYRTLLPGLSTSGEPSFEVSGWVWVMITGLLALGFVALFLERQLDRWRRSRPAATAFLRAWSTRAVLAAAGAALLFVVVPLGVLLLWKAGRGDLFGGLLQGALTRLGFTGGIEGTTAVQLPTVAAALGATVAVVTRIIRTAAGFAGSRLGRVVLPWAASLLAGLLLLLPFLKWTKDAALASPSDWTRELTTTALALTVVVLNGLFSNINRTSMHPFYKERLCSAFATSRTTATEACELPYSEPIRLSTLDTGGRVPELLVCAAGNVTGLDDVPPGRGCVSFVFSSSGCGAPALGPMVDTAQYERVVGARTLTLPGAVAVSGAAISPVMGRMTRPALRVLLTLVNARLGVWLPNPVRRSRWPVEEQAGGVDDQRAGFRTAVRRRRAEPGPLYLVREMLGRNRWDDAWLYVSDGGHWENLGVVELLRRGCSTVYVLDASGDTADVSATLGQAVALARSELGVEIDIDPSGMATDPETGWARTDHATGRIRYPDGRVGVIGVAKLAVTVDAPWDVRAYKRKDPAFPNHSTADQLYADERFEAYRSLGRHTAARLVDSMQPAEVQLPAQRDLAGADVTSSASGRSG